jgi:hypothetical protein
MKSGMPARAYYGFEASPFMSPRAMLIAMYVVMLKNANKKKEQGCGEQPLVSEK